MASSVWGLSVVSLCLCCLGSVCYSRCLSICDTNIRFNNWLLVIYEKLCWANLLTNIKDLFKQKIAITQCLTSNFNFNLYLYDWYPLVNKERIWTQNHNLTLNPNKVIESLYNAWYRWIQRIPLCKNHIIGSKNNKHSIVIIHFKICFNCNSVSNEQ